MIYLDYNATTPLFSAAWRAMQPYFGEYFGNPSSVHRAGRETRAAIDDARDRLAGLLGAKPHEIIFTSGGTESNNLAILGLARVSASNGKHLISNRAEHHAVLHALEHLEKQEGFEVTWLSVSPAGLIDPDELERAIRPDTVLVSIMTANNETGVIQPMEEISARCRKHGVLLHSDMVQSFGKLAFPVERDSVELGTAGGGGENFFSPARRSLAPPERRASARAASLLCDAASFGAHKFYGPKGAGFLYLRVRTADRSHSIWRRP